MLQIVSAETEKAGLKWPVSAEIRKKQKGQKVQKLTVRDDFCSNGLVLWQIIL